VVETGFTFCAMAFMVFVGCSPTGVRDRVKEADVRLTALEAAFNTMLDTLRPLVGDLNGGVAPPPPARTPTSPLARANLMACTRFSVRLITKDRNTMRADLHVFCKDRPQLAVYCPLGNFTIVSSIMDGVAPTELGMSAASPTMLAVSPNAASPLGLNAVAATMGINLGERRQRRREDDEYSTSLASCSTASTMRSKQHDYQPSEASLKLAMGMVTMVCARPSEPLEAFRPTVRGALVPPKAAMDEPSLLLALAAESVQILAGADPRTLDAAYSEVDPCREMCWIPKGLVAHRKVNAPVAEESFGVLRSSDDLEKLCRLVPKAAGKPSSQPACTSLGRSASFSDSEGSNLSDDEELGKTRPPSLADGYLESLPANSSQHLALVFDSNEDRDRCLSLFELAGLLPEPSPDWP